MLLPSVLMVSFTPIQDKPWRQSMAANSETAVGSESTESNATVNEDWDFNDVDSDYRTFLNDQTNGN